MDINPRLLKDEVEAKLDEWAKIDQSDGIRKAFEEPTKSLEFYKKQLRFWDEKKRQLAQISPKDFICEEEEIAYNDLLKCITTIYPPIEMKYLQMVSILESQTSKQKP